MTWLPDTARAVLESPALAHLVTLNPDGSPQVSIVWVGLDGDEIVAAHLPEHRKVRNIRHDSRVALSIETDTRNAMGLTEYLVVYGTARITEGGAAELLQRLAHTYLGPDVRFPLMDNPRRGSSPTSAWPGSRGWAPGRQRGTENRGWRLGVRRTLRRAGRA
jgi:PPOX class probable F420-dependent enzyme